jgi:hypothetical protein
MAKVKGNEQVNLIYSDVINGRVENNFFLMMRASSKLLYLNGVIKLSQTTSQSNPV